MTVKITAKEIKKAIGLISRLKCINCIYYSRLNWNDLNKVKRRLEKQITIKKVRK